MWYINTVQYSSAIKMNAVIPFAAKWVGPESITLSEVNHTEKDEYHGIPLRCGIFKK